VIQFGCASDAVPPGQPEKANYNLYAQTLGEKDRSAKALGVAGGMFFVGVNGIAMAAQRGHVNAPILKFFLPGLGLGGVGKKFLHRAVMRAWITASADLHRFKTEGAHLLKHLVQGKLVVDRVEDADGDVALRSGGRRRLLPRRGSRPRHGFLHMDSPGNRRSQQASAGRGEELPAVNRFTNSRAAHAEPPEVAFPLWPNYDPRHYTPPEGERKSQNRFGGHE